MHLQDMQAPVARLGERANTQQVLAHTWRARRNLQSSMQSALEAMGLLEDAAPVVTNSDAGGGGPSSTQGTRSGTGASSAAGESSAAASLIARRAAWFSDTVAAAASGTPAATAAAVVNEAQRVARRPEPVDPQTGAAPEAGACPSLRFPISCLLVAAHSLMLLVASRSCSFLSEGWQLPSITTAAVYVVCQQR